MNLPETKKLLDQIRNTDGRRLPDGMPAAWRELLKPYSYADCRAAVEAHFTDSTEWLTPAHIIRRVKSIRKARLNEITNPELNTVDAPDIDTELANRRHLVNAIAAGHLTPDDYRQYRASGQPLTDFIGAVKELPAPPRRDSPPAASPIGDFIRRIPS